MPRDDFTNGVKLRVAQRAGMRCANPECDRVTCGPSSTSGDAVNLGVAAHIAAASPGGPRYEPGMTPEQRSDLGNAIWLCQSCAKLIDSDPAQYPVDLLRRWRADAEARAAEGLSSPGRMTAPPIADITRIVLRSSPPDWVAFEGPGLYVYTHDPNITVQDASAVAREPFEEDWTLRFPDKHALRAEHEIRWATTPIRSYLLVWVDGGRVLLPAPVNPAGGTVRTEEASLARLFNALGPYRDRFDEYCGRAGLVLPSGNR